MANLTGVWIQTNALHSVNSGTTFIRQYSPDGTTQQIAWCSMSNDYVTASSGAQENQWVNVSYGTYDASAGTISLNVADVSAGMNENYSKITLSVSSDGKTLTLKKVTDGYAYSDVTPSDYTWTKQ